MRMFNQKKSVSCYQNAVEIYARFEDWKDNDRFYFIPLYLQMTYSCAGWVAEMAPDPVWLGSFVSAVRSHPELFQFKCPECGKTVFTCRTVGSPLSGRVDLEGRLRTGRPHAQRPCQAAESET